MTVEWVECEGKELTWNLGTAEDGKPRNSGTMQGRSAIAARWTLEGVYALVFF